jgi:hypothetical protein
VVTHRAPEEWLDRKASPFTFMTEGVPRAIEVARGIAAANRYFKNKYDHVFTVQNSPG